MFDLQNLTRLNPTGSYEIGSSYRGSVALSNFSKKVVYYYFFILDYALEFPKQGVSDYVNIWGMRSLTTFTICFWMKTAIASGTPFSYATSTAKNNELLIDYPADLRLYVGNEGK